MSVSRLTMRSAMRLKIALQRFATLRRRVLEHAWLHGFRVFRGEARLVGVERPSAAGGLSVDTHAPKDLRPGEREYPMPYIEWRGTTGGSVSAVAAVRDHAQDDEAEMERLASEARELIDSYAEFIEIGRRSFADYHAYLCRYIDEREGRS